MVLSQVEGFNSRRYKNADLETEGKLEKLLNALRDLSGKPDETTTTTEESDENDDSNETDENDDSNETDEDEDPNERTANKSSQDECDDLEDIDFDQSIEYDDYGISECDWEMMEAYYAAICENDDNSGNGACEAALPDGYAMTSSEELTSEEIEDLFCEVMTLDQQVNAVLCAFNNGALSEIEDDITEWVGEAFEKYNKAKHAKAVRAVANIFKKSFGKRLQV